MINSGLTKLNTAIFCLRNMMTPVEEKAEII
jgi:hypothetical protein